MFRNMLLAKLHNAVVNQTEIDYEGSFSIDSELLEMSGIITNEQVHVYNISKGTRFITYAIPAKSGSRIIGANGACLHKVKKGDRVIICTYGIIPDDEISTYTPTVFLLDKNNYYRIKGEK